VAFRIFDYRCAFCLCRISTWGPFFSDGRSAFAWIEIAHWRPPNADSDRTLFRPQAVMVLLSLLAIPFFAWPSYALRLVFGLPYLLHQSPPCRVSVILFTVGLQSSFSMCLCLFCWCGQCDDCPHLFSHPNLPPVPPISPVHALPPRPAGNCRCVIFGSLPRPLRLGGKVVFNFNGVWLFAFFLCLKFRRVTCELALFPPFMGLYLGLFSYSMT